MSETQDRKNAVVLTSGGLDSTTVIAIAQSEGYQVYSLSFDYQQRHRTELNAAARVAKKMNVKAHKVVGLDLRTIGGSALTDDDIGVPDADIESTGIPITYVPARNTVFLSIALGWAEVLNASAIFIGVNAVDYSGYPDCRPEYLEAYQNMANLATKAGVEGAGVKIHAPLLELTKADIIKRGLALGVDYSATVSCYRANELGEACGKCDSCVLRAKGFADAQVEDPTRYVS
ncbi:7-cyano-7-deazaguanine synthase QueC [Agarilytica rhodophyticola]|uniref:7-cyano-7-deazaguanine synthase QueC n=1 Tax=Agarilytica rhodophyticola TaxID=1737490 RepID=UPI000B34616C|nr:7-cyano-7-deazaguanine synthase QueC [Agarilytica rhodophyticola]